jgi:WD40 repeat protein
VPGVFEGWGSTDNLAVVPGGALPASARPEGPLRARVVTARGGPVLVASFDTSGFTAATVALSRDGKRAAWADGRGVAWARTADLDATATLTTAAECVELAWSPDSRRLACALRTHAPGETELEVFDVETGRLVLSRRGGPSYPEHLAFSPDGRKLVAELSAGITLFDLEAGPAAEPNVLTEAEGFYGASLALGSDGRVFVGRWAGDIWVLESTRHTGGFFGSAPANRVDSMLLSPDERLLVVSAEETVALLDARTGRLVATVALP